MRGDNWWADLDSSDDDGVIFVIYIEHHGEPMAEAMIEMLPDGDWTICDGTWGGEPLMRADKKRLRALPEFVLPVIQAGVGFLFPEVAAVRS